MTRPVLLTTRLLVALLGMVAGITHAQAAIRFVNHQATGTNNGTSWANAYREVRSALLAATTGDEVWVAQGTYSPDFNATTGLHDGNRDARFVLRAGVRVYGGFNGTEIQRAQRDWAANRVVFSGDIGTAGLFSDNTRTILHVPAGGPNTIIEGITFVLGNANSPEELGNGIVSGSGGAIHATGDLQIRFCSFFGNYAVYGGAIYGVLGAGKIINCLFYDNHARYVGGAFRIGVNGGGTPGTEVQNCTVVGCSSSTAGAFTAGALATVTNNVVWGNTGENAGLEGWETAQVWLDGTVSGNFLQEPIFRYPSGGRVIDPQIVRLPSSGPDLRWGTADDDRFGAGLASISPVIGSMNPLDLPRDVTDLDGDGNLVEPIPFDLQRRLRVLDGYAEAGALELLNLPPSAIRLSPWQVVENEPAGTVIGQLTSDDANGGPFTYQLVDGPGDTHNHLVQIDGTALRTSAGLDYESARDLTVRLLTRDSLGASWEQTVPIAVLDDVEQIVQIEVVRETAYRPVAGTPPTPPGSAPAHWGILRLSRTGQIDAVLSLPVVYTGTAIVLNDYITNRGSQTVVEFAAGQSEAELTIQPLFGAFGQTSQRVATVALPPGGLAYKVNSFLSSASVTIHSSPAQAWASLHPEFPPGAAGHLARLFPSHTAPGVGFQPDLGPELPPESPSSSRLMMVATPSPLAPDVQLGFESSEDLLAWRPLTGWTTRALGQATGYLIPEPPGSRQFIRPTAVLVDRPAPFTTSGSESISMVGIPAGRILMGVPAVPGPSAVNVQFTQPFWMSRTEITRGQYRSLIEGAPVPPSQLTLPIDSVSSIEATQFAEALTQREQTNGTLPPGLVYRLPTEAEWEFASAAGTESGVAIELGYSLDSYAWHSENSFSVSHAVASKRSNAWGLYDMYGHLAEWTNSWDGPVAPGVWFDLKGPPEGTHRIVRGGHLLLGAAAQNSWWRQAAEPELQSSVVGFRLVLAAPLP